MRSQAKKCEAALDTLASTDGVDDSCCDRVLMTLSAASWRSSLALVATASKISRDSARTYR